MDRTHRRAALSAPRGLRRLFALHEYRLAFYDGGTLPGGCFFVATQAEFDDRPGPVRDAIAAAVADWLELVRTVATQAVELGELRPDTDVAQLAFEIDALGLAVVICGRLIGAPQVAAYARAGVLDRLRALSPLPQLLPKE